MSLRCTSPWRQGMPDQIHLLIITSIRSAADDNLLDTLDGASAFSKIDLKSGYHQIRVREDYGCKIALKTRFGQYEYLVM